MDHVGLEWEGMIPKGKLRAAAKRRGLHAGQGANPRVNHSKCNKLSKGLIHFQALFITIPHSHATILLKLSHTLKELCRPSHRIDGRITG